jgi:hypothetical protein
MKTNREIRKDCVVYVVNVVLLLSVEREFGSGEGKSFRIVSSTRTVLCVLSK